MIVPFSSTCLLDDWPPEENCQKILERVIFTLTFLFEALPPSALGPWLHRVVQYQHNPGLIWMAYDAHGTTPLSRRLTPENPLWWVWRRQKSMRREKKICTWSYKTPAKSENPCMSTIRSQKEDTAFACWRHNSRSTGGTLEWRRFLRCLRFIPADARPLYVYGACVYIHIWYICVYEYTYIWVYVIFALSLLMHDHCMCTKRVCIHTWYIYIRMWVHIYLRWRVYTCVYAAVYDAINNIFVNAQIFAGMCACICVYRCMHVDG
jgi:hypothetical protein